ncbi:kinase-like domain-containing protein [Geopyxis carbonaria]|nr:kinase-like domain-containing protein [Geopyxis carbonaria]
MSTSAMSPPGQASPPRATRPAHTRPTTYSGPSPSAPMASASNSASATGPPIAPPPRTSSSRQVPTVDSTSDKNRSGSRSGTNGNQERERSDRDRERRKAEESRGSQPVGRSNSTRGTSSRNASGGSNSASQSGDKSSSSRRRQDSGARSAGASSGGLQVTNPDGSGAGRSGTRKETRFGEYILGQTLGEGEFGKVKLGWRRDGGVQVAIKLIRRDSVSPHPNRLSKIYREISILRTLSHPNIVRLHEMVETDRHIGIILEYASGGELFDYILTHRYLKDPPACRLFAQLVSGVGYLHKKGIVHRDLKLENLLLDRNRNIIITDFGFANVFDPMDELGELENRLTDPSLVKELERGVPHTDRKPDGSSLLSIIGPGQTRRRGDLMSTSCGSPCYAAPELVVSDGLYTGRKVDVWSCGVILYAMLAGYLPFDDDPANPEGDNINLLYKYIVSTPLTFPEYVTPHARDLLRRILVPDPRKRADLFEVARHSWLSPFADIVNKVTSATTGIKDVETITTIVREPKPEQPSLARSASVREPTSHAHVAASANLGQRHHAHEQVQHSSPKSTGDAKRRTVQVEYVEPKSQTKRGSAVDPDHEHTADSRRQEEAEIDDSAPPPVVATHKESHIARAATTAGTGRSFAKFMDKQKTREPNRDDPKLQGPEKGKTRPVSYQYQQSTNASRAAAAAAAAAVTDGQMSGTPSRRPSRDKNGPSAPSGKSYPANDAGTRPNTANSLGSNRLPSRGGSYSLPAAPSLVANNAQGRIAMPKSAKPYTISNPMVQPETVGTIAIETPANRPQTQPEQPPPKGHKRANTVGGGPGIDTGRFLGKIMGGSDRPDTASRPPIVGGTEAAGRQSMDQGRKFEKPSSGSGKARRFSLLPTSFSLRNMGGESKHERKASRGSRQYTPPAPQPVQVQSQPQLAAPRADGASAWTGSDTSLAAGSAPASVGKGARGSIDVSNASTRKTTLGKHKKFGEAFEGEVSSGGHGSSGPARRVMDFFRRRGVNRSKGT